MYRSRLWLASLVAFTCSFCVYAETAPSQHWVATWTAAQEASDTGAGASKEGFDNQTVRMVVHTSIGGQTARIHLSNAFGATSLSVGSVHIALPGPDGTIVAGTDHTVTFNGDASTVIPPGAPMISDPVQMKIPQSGNLAVSIYLPDNTGAPTLHSLGLETTYISGPGNFAGETAIPNAATRSSWFFLSEVDVQAPRAAYAVIAIGDSITDGYGSTPDANRRWPDILAKRVLGSRHGKSVAVVNEGISGNRILHDEAGPNGLARFDRDVLAVAGARVLIVLEGINDIGWPDEASRAYASQSVTADEIIGGLRQIVDRAHAHGILALGATLTPYEGAGYASPAGEKKREAVNAWIREPGHFDGVVDFDAAVQDPNHPARFAPEDEHGDHLHPNDKGYEAMANAVDLRLLTLPRAGK